MLYHGSNYLKHKHSLQAKSLTKTVIPIACFLIPFLLTACSPVIGNTQPIQTEWSTLEPGVTLGQTFVANYDGLSGIQVKLAPQTPGTGKIALHLRTDAQSTTDIAVSNLPISNVNTIGSYSFFFTPQSVSRRNYYYVSINLNGDGAVKIGVAPGNTYLDGARYVKSIAQDGQLSFRLMYSIRRLGLGLVREFATWGVILLASGFLFLLPGWALLRLLWPGWSTRTGGSTLTWMEKLGLSAGVSLAIYPILLLWTWLVGLRLGPLYAWLPPLAGLGILLWANRSLFARHTSVEENDPQSTSRHFRPIHLRIRWTLPSLPTIVVTIVIGLLIFSRFWVIRTLDAPMWGDSYQHSVITQRIVDHNGLFQSWQPYAELQTFTYHFGFHSSAAVFHWVTGLSIPRTVLWVGQILNILAIISLYPLAMKVCRNRWGGVAAIIIAGLLAPVPMSYTNWGRYTQLDGQIILVVAIYILWNVMIHNTVAGTTIITSTPANSETLAEQPSSSYRVITLAVIVMGGLALTHFRILIFALMFLVAIFVYSVFSRRNIREWKSLTLKTIWIGLGGGIIFLPWFINTFGGKILSNLSRQLTTPAGAVPIDMQSYNAVGNLLQYLPLGIWLLLPLATAWGLWKKRKEIAIISLWGFLLLVAANPAWLSLPGTGALSNYAVFIAIYIPAGILIGGVIGLIADEYTTKEWRADLSLKIANGWKANLLRFGVVGIRKNYRFYKLVNGIIAFAFVVISLLGVRQRLGDLHPEKYALLTRPDLRAASWIKDNLQPEANILVNSFFAYGGSLIVGSDGGWWLSLLSKRHTTLPPLNYGTEQGFQTNYRAWVNELSTAIIDKGLVNPEVLSMLQERKITHVYIGQQQGRVNYTGSAVFDPRQLVDDPHFRTIYHQDRVWIFEVVPTP